MNKQAKQSLWWQGSLYDQADELVTSDLVPELNLSANYPLYTSYLVGSKVLPKLTCINCKAVSCLIFVNLMSISCSISTLLCRLRSIAAHS